MIRRVLDRVLEPPGVPQSDSRAASEMDAQFDPSLLPPFDNLNDMDWLNTIDWTQGSWMDFNT